MSAIPIPDAAPAIALPSDDERLRRLVEDSGAQAQSIIPKAVSNRGIAVTPQTPGRAIPINRATGAPEELNNQGKAIAPGIAGLWARAENIHNPVLRTLGKIGAVGARAIDVAGSVAAPGVMAQIPGTALNQKVEEASANRNRAADTKNAEQEAATEQTQAETAAMPAKVKLENAQADALEDKEEKPEDLNQQYADAVHAAVKAGKNPLEDPQVQQFADAIQNVQKQPQAKTPNDFEQFYADWIKDNNFHDTAHNRLLARKQFAAAGQMPPHDPQQLAIGPDGKVIALRPGVTVPQGTKTVAGDLAGSKPTADEQKRADLVENLNENLDQLEDIVNRRPDLFGKVAGRITKAREWIGSDDPDVASLKGIEDRLGMVQQSSHGMRSAQHVEQSANSVLNNFKNGPDAMKKAIADARKSGATFTQDVQRKTGATAAPTDGGATDPLGILK